jgi:hypothetical protein
MTIQDRARQSQTTAKAFCRNAMMTILFRYRGGVIAAWQKALSLSVDAPQEARLKTKLKAESKK